MIPVGKILCGKYRLLATKLGEGGMGVVYLGRNVKNSDSVAIKIPRSKYISNTNAVARFLESCRNASRLNHENICRILEFGSYNDTPFMVMPIIYGRSLEGILSKGKPLNVEKAVDIASQILTGLQVAHNEGVIHRDIKSSNVMVEEHGKIRKVTVLDFGISKALDSNTKLTRSGIILGTPFNMAPEQAAGAKNIDHRVDIYALGVLLYEMLTTRKPFDRCTPDEGGANLALPQSFIRPRLLNPNIPGSLEEIILKAMQRDPELRYETAEIMRYALLKYSTVNSEDSDDALTRKTTQTLIPTDSSNRYSNRKE